MILQEQEEGIPLKNKEPQKDYFERFLIKTKNSKRQL
jgi:hypothetical protein